MHCSQSQQSDFGPDFPPVFKNQRPVGFPLSPFCTVAKDIGVRVRLKFEFQVVQMIIKKKMMLSQQKYDKFIED